MTTDIINTNLSKLPLNKFIKSISKEEGYIVTPAEHKYIKTTLQSNLKVGVRRELLNIIAIGILFEPSFTVSSIRKSGILRYYKVISNDNYITKLASNILLICNEFKYSYNKDINYFKSILELKPIHNLYNDLYNNIMNEIILFNKMYPNKSLLNTLLSFVDLLFFTNFHPKLGAGLLQLESRSKEEIASGVSLLVFYLFDKKLVNYKNISFTSDEYFASERIMHLINWACQLSELRELEILIESFNYTANDINGIVNITGLKVFEKSVRLGYIRTQIQSINNSYLYEDAVSFYETVQKIKNIKDSNLIEFIQTNDYPRYRIIFPEPIIDVIINELLKPDDLFREEIGYLDSIYKELFINEDDILTYKISNEIEILDLIKIHRLFSMFYYLLLIEYNEKQISSEIISHSLIKILTSEQIILMLGKLMDGEKVKEYLKMASWSIEDKNVFDLQYHPFIKTHDNYIIPSSILVNSDFVRNIIASEYKNNNLGLFKDGENDELINRLKSTFNEANILCFTNVNLGVGEIDFVAIYNDTLLIFECKNTLHPTSVFDLRTINDYILKAEKQLTAIEQTFNEKKLLNILEKKLEINLSNVTNCLFAIVLTDRVLNGGAFKYPVRNYYELENIILRGTINTEKGKYWLWKHKKLDIEDLQDYLSNESKIFRFYFDSLEESFIQFGIKKPIIQIETYYFDRVKTMKILDQFTSTLEKMEN